MPITLLSSIPVNLSDLHDVSILSPMGGQYLRYNDSLSLWQNSFLNTDVYKYLDTSLTSSNGITLTKMNGTQTINIGLSLTTTDITSSLGYTPVNVAGDTMLGPLYLSSDPVSPLEAATKQYVDANAGGGGISPTGYIPTQVFYANMATALAQSPNLTFDGTSLFIVGGTAPLEIDGNMGSISASAMDGDVILMPNGNGSVIIGPVGDSVLQSDPGTSLRILGDTGLTLESGIGPVTVGPVGNGTIESNVGSSLTLLGDSGLSIGSTVGNVVINLPIGQSTTNKITIAGPASLDYATNLGPNDIPNKQYVDDAIAAGGGGSPTGLIPTEILFGSDTGAITQAANLTFNSITNSFTVGGNLPVEINGDTGNITAISTNSDLTLTPNGIGSVVMGPSGNGIIQSDLEASLTIIGNSGLTLSGGTTAITFNIPTISKLSITGPTAADYATGLTDNDLTNKQYVDDLVTGRISGMGTVTSIDAVGLDGVTINGTPITTAGTINIGLGAITPDSVASTGTITGSNLSGTNTGDETQTSILSKLGITTLSGSNTGDQTITLTGDVTGSGNGTFATTLSDTGVAIGTYTKITVDSKGRVTTATDLIATDITTALNYIPVNKTGDTLTGPLILDADPTLPLGAATKQYVDNIASGVSVHLACETSTTTPLPTVIYNNGTSGIGATLTADAPYASINSPGIGGCNTLTVGSRILVKDQIDDKTQNGVYSVTNLGSSTTPFVLTRATDFDGSPNVEASAGYMTYIQEGTLAGSQWVETNVGTGAPGDYLIIGTDDIIFGQFSGPGTYTAGTGLSLIGTQFNNIGVVSNIAGTGISVSPSSGNVTITNTGVLSNLAGTGIGISNTTGNVTITNTGVTSLIAGNNISISNSTGNITVDVSGTVPASTTANNITSGAPGSIPYQVASGSTSFIPAGTSGQILTSNGSISVPTWQTPPVVTAGTLTGTTLASNVVSSSLTSVGTLTSMTSSGVVSAASFVPTGSIVPTNGIYSSASNTLNFATNSVRRVEIDANGHVGINVTPSAWANSSVYGTLDIGATGAVYGTSSSVDLSQNTFWSSGISDIAKTAGTAGKFTIIGNTFQWRGAPSVAAGASQSFATTMSLDATGNLNITGSLQSTGVTTSSVMVTGMTPPANGMYLSTINALGFTTNSTKRLEISSSGSIGIGTTPNTWGSGFKSIELNSSGLSLGGSSTTGVVAQNSYNNGTDWIAKETAAGGIYFQSGGSHSWYSIPSTAAGTAQSPSLKLSLDTSGNLTATGNVTAYSDERLKENWNDLPADFVEKLSSVKVGTYDRTDVDIRQVGVSAQSLQTVLPEAVMNGEYLSVAYGNAALAACVMMAREIQSLRAEIAALRG